MITIMMILLRCYTVMLDRDDRIGLYNIHTTMSSFVLHRKQIACSWNDMVFVLQRGLVPAAFDPVLKKGRAFDRDHQLIRESHSLRTPPSPFPAVLKINIIFFPPNGHIIPTAAQHIRDDSLYTQIRDRFSVYVHHRTIYY